MITRRFFQLRTIPLRQSYQAIALYTFVFEPIASTMDTAVLIKNAQEKSKNIFNLNFCN